MSGSPLARFHRRACAASGLAAAALAIALAAAPASAFEFFDGRLQIHGFFEEQLRAIARDMDASDNWDMTQMYSVLNVEIEASLIEDGWGPIDLASAFVRAEVRYDCIWTRACGMFENVDVYGNNLGKFPGRYSDARRTGYTGAVFTGDTRHIHGLKIDQLDFFAKDQSSEAWRTPAYLWHFPGVDTLFGVPGPDGILGTADDPAFYTFERFVKPGEEYRFGLRQIKGATGGQDLQPLGPWSPRNDIDPIATLGDRANPFNPLDIHPIYGTPGSTATPFRPAPNLVAGTNGGRRSNAHGLFLPNQRVARMLDRDDFDDFDQNFSEEELSWNRGASQQDEKELKEAYLDLEFFDSRLWVRVGKQSIVWGKTELFRTTDQFNPQDLALASLPSLEESRISLWSARAVWSFYTVGPLEDFRLEAAVNFDNFEPVDLGRCGEPYTPFPVCNKSAGLFAHGLAGFGLAGEVRPPEPFDSWKGIEAGVRAEFRWDRFSFALTDFYGYDDFPYLDAVFLYERNVDPLTGRPRRAGAKGACTTGDPTIEPACLAGGDDALRNHHANQQRFAVICASSVGFSDLDPSVCAQSVFNSNKSALTGAPDVSPTLAEVLSTIYSGSTTGRNLVLAQFIAGASQFPIVQLNEDINDGAGSGIFAPLDITIQEAFTDEQEALIGCGPYWGTECDTSLSTAYGGLDLLNAEQSVLLQSWPGFPGTKGSRWQMTDTTVAQPGTLGFVGGTVARRYENERIQTLPGARSPFASETDLSPSEWSAGVDGCVRPTDPDCGGASEVRHPFTNAYFRSETAAFSWNFLMTLVALSGLGKPSVACAPGQAIETCRTIDEFLPSDEFGTTRGDDSCSYTTPQNCSNVQAIYAVAHTTVKSVRAGGNGRFGRTDFDWHVAGSGVLRYEKRNVMGISMDFAEDRTKSTWSFEATWIAGVPMEDTDEPDLHTDVDTYNLTVSVDRPTFINFLNPDRTFFINTQWFFQWVSGYQDSFPSTGPFNVLATLRVETGYFRDRLLPGFTLVYDFNSKSGGMLPGVTYRFTENLSATVAASWFWGRFQRAKPALYQVSDPPYRAGSKRNNDWVEEGLSPIRDRDEVSLILRYTF